MGVTVVVMVMLLQGMILGGRALVTGAVAVKVMSRLRTPRAVLRHRIVMRLLMM